MAKCWCRLELIWMPYVTEAGPTILGHRWECPECCGEDYVWRPCAFGGDEREIQGGALRYCQLSAHFNSAKVPDEMYPGDCASCPIPTLVAAVKVADEYYGGGVEVNYPSRKLREILDAALASLPTPESPSGCD